MSQIRMSHVTHKNVHWGSPSDKSAGRSPADFSESVGGTRIFRKLQQDGWENGAGEATADKSLIFNSCICSRALSVPVLVRFSILSY